MKSAYALFIISVLALSQCLAYAADPKTEVIVASVRILGRMGGLAKSSVPKTKPAPLSRKQRALLEKRIDGEIANLLKTNSRAAEVARDLEKYPVLKDEFYKKLRALHHEYSGEYKADLLRINQGDLLRQTRVKILGAEVAEVERHSALAKFNQQSAATRKPAAPEKPIVNGKDSGAPAKKLVGCPRAECLLK